MSSLFVDVPLVQRGRRRRASEENKFRDLAMRSIPSQASSMVYNWLPGGATAWLVYPMPVYASNPGPGEMTDHAHKDIWDGGYDNYGFTGPD